MKFFDLNKQYSSINSSLDKSIKTVIERGDFIQGKEVKALEQKLSDFVGARCLTVANGTDALYIALLSLGIGEGDEVITPSFTWVSTVEAIKLVKATPVFCDVEYESFNISYDGVEKLISNRTKAVLAVSLFGQCSELLKLKEIADRENIFLIEDAAQSFGADHKGNNSCSVAHVSTTSFFPTKPLSCFGDGGAIFSKDNTLVDKADIISKNGQSERYNYKQVGVNSRLDTIQAAVLLEKLKIFEKEREIKQKIAAFYEQELCDLELIKTPKIENYNSSVFALYTIRVKSPFRDKLALYLQSKSIPTGVYYPVGLHKTKPYKQNVNLPITDKLNTEVLSLPMHPYLNKKELKIITEAINSFKP